MTSPDAPAPVEAAVILAPVVRLTVFAFTVIVPPVAVGTVPEVMAESVPPFWSVSELVRRLIFPPAPLPSASVKMPVPVPSTRMD